MSNFRLVTHDKIALSANQWLVQGAKANILLIHGHGEHAGRYEHLISEMNQRHLNVFSMDLRGHGKSGGKRGHVPNFEAFMKDIVLLFDKAKEAAALPTILYGQSMGGNLVLNFALRHMRDIKAVVASSPWLHLAFEPPAWKVKMAAIMNQIFPSFTERSALDATMLSHDPEEARLYIADPLVHDYASARLFHSINQAGQWAIEHAHELAVPCLIMHGTADKITDFDSSAAFAKGSTQVTFKAWEGQYHELHNEIDKEIMINYALDWIEAQIPI